MLDPIDSRRVAGVTCGAFRIRLFHLERDLLLPLEPEGARNLALAGGSIGGADEFEDLLR